MSMTCRCHPPDSKLGSSTIAVVVSTVQFEPHTKSRKSGLYIPPGNWSRCHHETRILTPYSTFASLYRALYTVSFSIFLRQTLTNRDFSAALYCAAISSARGTKSPGYWHRWLFGTEGFTAYQWLAERYNRHISWKKLKLFCCFLGIQSAIW